MAVVLGILCVLVAVLLIFAVVIQNSKGGGLSSTFGGSSGATQLFGARKSNEGIEKITWYLAIGLALVAFAANVIGTRLAQQNTSLLMEDAIQTGVQYNANPTEMIDPNAIPSLQQTTPEATPEGDGN